MGTKTETGVTPAKMFFHCLYEYGKENKLLSVHQFRYSNHFDKVCHQTNTIRFISAISR